MVLDPLLTQKEVVDFFQQVFRSSAVTSWDIRGQYALLSTVDVTALMLAVNDEEILLRLVQWLSMMVSGNGVSFTSSQDLLEHIPGIKPPFQTTTTDSLGWLWSENSGFSVKSTYDERCNYPIGLVDNVWGVLKKFQGVPQVKSFLWLKLRLSFPYGITEELLTFVSNIAHHPETWLDFPIDPDEDSDDFEMLVAQKEHAMAHGR
ncbi:hypothetical protein V6N13_001540 [Hibiscus sabdariffa]